MDSLQGSFIRHGLDRQECEAEGLFMILAGTESTASAIRATLVHTMTTPRVYQKLKQEIKKAVDEARASTPITFEEAKKFPYLQVSAAPRLIFSGSSSDPY